MHRSDPVPEYLVHCKLIGSEGADRKRIGMKGPRQNYDSLAETDSFGAVLRHGT